MEAALQRRVQRYGWDKATDFYDNSWQCQLLPAQQRLLQFAGVKSGEKVIDIACGTGLVTFKAAAQAGDNGFVSANDISDKMVERARAIAGEKRVRNVHFERMDAEELAVNADTHDVALCALGLMYVPDPNRALKEMYRVLKKGGRAVVAVWGKRFNCGWAEIFEIIDRRVSTEVCPMFFNLGNDEVLGRSLTKAGFKNVEVERFSSPLEYASAGEACVAAFDGGPVALAYHKFSAEIKEEVKEEYLASISRFQEGSGYNIPGEFVIAAGYK